MAKESHSGRDNAAKKHGRKENVITAGGIETCNEGFMGNIETSAPFSPTYGNHKRIGSQMLPTKTGGRGGSKVSFRKKLMTGGN
jgi:hypothetical protein